MKINLVSLGCARNLVDSEIMLGRLIGDGWEISRDPAQADVIVVNTCGFISDAVEESIDTIMELAEYKETGRCKRLVVAGCLVERYGTDLAESLKEADVFIGTGAYSKIVEAIRKSLERDERPCLIPKPGLAGLQQAEDPRVKSLGHMAYIKIAEGCRRRCTYCMIPDLRGTHRSRMPEDILKEAEAMANSGVKELVLVAQDTTWYGKDLKPASGLGNLLSMLSGISENIWIRFLYGHPVSLDQQTIEAVLKHNNICSYFDIPIQHASDRVLKKMGRNCTKNDLRRLFSEIRRKIPEAALRTTAIVGFPGETDNDFDELVDFAEEIGFNHLGVFTYSDSEELASHKLPNHVDPKLALERMERLMEIQAEISFQHNKKQIGNTLKVLVENIGEDSRLIGRTVFQAPEVDGLTYVTGQGIEPGNFISARITDCSEYDLFGELV